MTARFPDLRAALAFLFTASFVASPLFTSPFSGFRADQLPIPQVDPPIQPEGYAFAIWGLIYAWLVISACWGLAFRVGDDGWERVRTPLILSLAVGTPWLWIANQSALWATVAIWIMAATAISRRCCARPTATDGCCGHPWRSMPAG